jgi:2-polyprenyl-3-methyl-5-hydroxy-6-metoxy-1,4-benzoquinol methylase
MAEPTFRELEHEGWLVRAGEYDGTLGQITTQAIEPILATFGDLKDKRFLDVGCGTGHLAALAASRGAESEGLDFAAAMVARAQANHPSLSPGHRSELADQEMPHVPGFKRSVSSRRSDS